MNSHIRDNLLETSPAAANAAGDIVYADAANSMGSRLPIGAAHGALISTGSGPTWRVPDSDSRTDAATGTGTIFYTLGGANWYNDADDVAVTVTTGTAALVHIRAKLSNSTAGAYVAVGYGVSGASTVSGHLARSLTYESGAANDAATIGITIWQALTSGLNTFTLLGLVSAGTGSISVPELIVQPL